MFSGDLQLAQRTEFFLHIDRDLLKLFLVDLVLLKVSDLSSFPMLGLDASKASIRLQAKLSGDPQVLYSTA